MYPTLTPILWFELVVAVLIAVVFLWKKPEYGLFLYAFTLGFPDIAWPLGSTINIRVDDVLILVFLARTILWVPSPASRMQKSIFTWQTLFFLACIVSIIVETARGTSPGGYETAKMAGCAAIVLALPRLVQSERRLRFFVSGMVCAGIAVVVQIHEHLGEAATRDFANFQQLKSAATFSTWNPNTIGQAGILFVFAAALGGIVFAKTLAQRIFWPGLATIFALLPALVYVRGTSLSIAAGFIVFFCMTRRWKWVLIFAAVCLGAIFYLHVRDSQLLEDATTVNLATGQGLSHRFDRWGMALQAIRKQPVVGHGFGQELPYLTLIGSEGRAHDAYLTVWIELGLGGLLVFAAAIFQFLRAGFLLYRAPQFRSQGALILALIVALCLDSVGLSTLYWEKLPTIALSLAAVVVGLCERSDTELTMKEVRAMACEPYAQHS
jgi:O-antigen ligase